MFVTLLVVVGLSLLIHRRMFDARVRATSHPTDLAVLIVLWIQLTIGLVTLPFSWEHRADGSVMLILADWAQRIVTLRPVDSAALALLPWPYLVHIVLGMTIFLLFPFSRLVHIWSGFAAVAYLFRPYQVVRSRRLNVPAGHNLPPSEAAGRVHPQIEHASLRAVVDDVAATPANDGRLKVDAGDDGPDLLTVTGRYDGSSRFGAANKWGFFPSAALGWRLSEEPFLRDLGWLSDLKLRASRGKLGSDATGNYQYLQAFSFGGNYPFGGVNAPGITSNTLPNPDITWEESLKTDVGHGSQAVACSPRDAVRDRLSATRCSKPDKRDQRGRLRFCGENLGATWPGRGKGASQHPGQPRGLCHH